MGYCAGYNAPGYANQPGGMGRGRNRGRFCCWGFGRGRMMNAAPGVAGDEVSQLKHQASWLENMLAGIRQRLSDIESKSDLFVRHSADVHTEHG